MSDFWTEIAATLEAPKSSVAAAYFYQLCAVRPDALFQSSEPWQRRSRDQERAYLPIEAFRPPGDLKVAQHRLVSNAPDKSIFFKGQDVARTFRSSGTTDLERSQSHFSHDGLLLYKAQSLFAFFGLVQRMFAGDPRQVIGLSLVPPVSDWPDSSLAQMTAWISEYAVVHYASAVTLAQKIAENVGSPLWIFGTAFHVLNAIDAKNAAALPHGSCLIETGGLKGQARQVTKSELYDEISRAFHIPESAIVSEYGMCELACQAYEWQSEGKRQFYFPSWVKTEVVTGPGQISACGTGALLIDDPLRIDYPWPLRSEDIAALSPAGFQLIERIAKAPLKGCSLGVEPLELVVKQNSFIVDSANQWTGADYNQIAGRSHSLSAMLHNFCTQPRPLAALSQELGSAAAARSAVCDLLEGLPKTPADWNLAVQTAAVAGQTAQHWLFILPNNHSIVGLYPLALAYVIGLDVSLRLPERFAAATSFLQLFCDELSKLMTAAGLSLTLKEPNFKLGRANLPASVGAVLCYGSDETLAQISATAGRPIQGFGNRIAISILEDHALTRCRDAVIKDVLSLGQQGCFSSRLLIVLASSPETHSFDDDATVARHLLSAAQKFWQMPLPLQARLGHELESWRYRQLSDSQKSLRLLGGTDADTLLLPIWRPADILELSLSAFISKHPFVLPTMFVAKNTLSKNVKNPLAVWLAQQAIGKVTTTPDLQAPLEAHLKSPVGLAKYRYYFPHVCELGRSNSVIWDGTHEGAPLFLCR